MPNHRRQVMSRIYREVMTTSEVPLEPAGQRRGWWPDQWSVKRLWNHVSVGCLWLALAFGSIVAFGDWSAAMFWGAMAGAFFALGGLNASRPAPRPATVVYRAGYAGLVVGMLLVGIAYSNV